MRLRLCILLALLFTFGHSLFEDQIGKFDWAAKNLGCYTDVVFKSSDTGKKLLLATSDRHAVGRINTNTGDLDWRQLSEKEQVGRPQLVVRDSRVAIVISDGYVRAFDVHSGIFKWQHMFEQNTTRDMKFALSSRILAIFDGVKIYGFVGKDRVTSTWSAAVDSDTQWAFLKVIGDSVYAVGALKTNEQIRVLKLDARSGGIEKAFWQVVDDSNFFIHSCLLSTSYLVCPARTSVYMTNLLDPTVNGALVRVEVAVGTTVIELVPLRLATGPSEFFVAKSSDNLLVYTVVANGRLSLPLKLDRSHVFTLSRVPSFTAANQQSENGGQSEESLDSSNYIFAVYYDAQRLLKIFDLKKRTLLSDFRINPTPYPTEASTLPPVVAGANARPVARVKSVHVVSAGDFNAFQILTVRQDCRTDFYEAHIQFSDGSTSTTMTTPEWIRFEALAYISGVEMLDLPLSESQARIETEFGAEHEPLWRSFFLRITSQVEQLQRSLVAVSNCFAESAALLTSRRSGASPSSVFRHLFGYGERRANRGRSATVLKVERSTASVLERDYFNLRKLIVATTLTGSIYAINSDDGEVIWSTFLGSDYQSPIANQLGQPTVPLFIQRGTALFQYASQAATVYHCKNSKKTCIYVFNPITGATVETLHLSAVKRVELLPFENSEAIRPLVVIHTNESVTVHPTLYTGYKPPYPVYMMFIEPSVGVICGTIVDFTAGRLREVWKSELGFLSTDERIVSAVGKPQTQRVHSQGKVLGDRSVLYKYANPNLIAIASADETHGSMGIWLVDGVSGQVVHSMRHSRVLPAIHLVQCENWLVYTYWNDKARRTEMGIIELYEGLEQTSAKHFNSFTPLKKPLVTFSQSYVFPHGVSAMAASETEQGLTSRSLIVAMPFGGVLEVSRRFLDARRPLEMTAELREEMVIPYMPELPVLAEDLINYNQTVHNVHGIKTTASGLESTSLVFVYGLDLFYTRVTPSGTFDILKDDFDYVLISIVMLVLVIASVLSKRLWRYQNLKQAWA